MVTKKLCDVCGAEIPETIGMEHNEAAQTYHGDFSYMSGVLIEMTDLCKDCALKVKDFIEQLKKGGV
jgi:hypothetical protein